MTSLVALLLSASCSSGPQPILAGDACARCYMPVADERWGAELITRTGVVRKYDAIECMVADLREEYTDSAAVRSFWVVPYDGPGTLVPAGDALYLRSPALRSPMGELTAFRTDAARQAAQARHDGELLTWADVLASAGSPGLRHSHDDATDH